MSDAIQSRWDEVLTRFSQDLVPTEEHLAAAKSVADRLFRVLQSNRVYRIDRAMIMGSIGKKTALKIDCDFDCNVFVNNVLPHNFKHIKTVFEEVIVLSNLHAEHIRDSKVALQLAIDGFEFDVVPAINFRDQNGNEEQQRQRAMSHIRQMSNPARDGYKYGSSLVEMQVEFIKRQSGFVHDLIRLAKYWNKSIFLSEFIQGRSSLIECIATHAANVEETQFSSTKSILRAFRRFLGFIEHFNSLEIVFEMFYGRWDIDAVIARQRPLVMDPSNPFRNYAYDLVKSPYIMHKLQSFAKTTIARLQTQFSSFPSNLGIVFETQPPIAPSDLVRKFLPSVNPSCSYLLGVKDRGNTSHPNMIVRNEEKFKGKGPAIKILQSYLWNNVEVIQATQLSKQELQEKVEEIIDCRIHGYADPRKWTPSDDKHVDYDLTFEVPCAESLIKLSLNWP